MKQILSLLTMLLIVIGFFPANTYSSDTGYFIVTAYYSPLPDQQHYIMGSYEKEIRMNGRGTNGASGREVFSWMLAAPKKYAFGTKIYLEGLGIGDVQDRGGAIVQKGQRWFKHDRIDVWVGKWEEGLQRAMYWGNRKVKGQVIARSKASTLDYSIIPAPAWATNNLVKSTVVANFFSAPLGVWSNQSQVKQLQEFLTQAWLYSWEIDGVYNNDIINAVFDFQVENALISYESEYGAGYWGTQTRKLFLKKYLSGEYTNPLESIEQDVYTTLFDGPANSPEKVEVLQDVLSKLDLYSAEIDGDYSSISDVIMDLQLREELIENKYHPAAGWFGPKTRELVQSKYSSYLEQQKILAELEVEKKKLQELSGQQATQVIENIDSVAFGQVSPSVRELQLTLSKLWYFNHKDTAIFGKVTSNSILKFQIDSELVLSASDVGAGNYGPKTKQALLDALTQHIYEQKLIEREQDNPIEQESAEIIYFTA